MSWRTPLIPLLFLVASTAALAGEPTIRSHALEVDLDPSARSLSVADRFVVERDGGGVLTFRLNAGLAVGSVVVDGDEPLRFERVEEGSWAHVYELELGPAETSRATVELTATGTIADEVREAASLSFVVGDDTRGVVEERGAYLSPGSAWYPIDGSVSRFDVVARVPAPYLVCTQGTLTSRSEVLPDGRRGDHTRWRGKHDADGLYLVAGRWKRFERTIDGVTVGAYLGERNVPGAEVLLTSTAEYLAKYGEVLGPYAYDRFDVVENWFTTGYGMPEFTLLGEHVIARMLMEAERTGGIPAGYLDHEIVHCWWGNLVFPDYARGNWCEGLTSYCSNYLSKEWQGPEEARAHRERTILRYSLRVDPEREYPVRSFLGKSEDADDDIGYGKLSMVFHLLRREIGDERFWGTLRRVSRDYAGRRMGWDDWQREFETSSDRNLSGFFAQWLDRTGAPQLELRDARVERAGGRLRVSATVHQVLSEGEEPWRVALPVVVETLDGREERIVDLAQADTHVSVSVNSTPLSITLDPESHVFRRLAPSELPPCLAATLESEPLLVVFPEGDGALEAVARRAVANKGGRAVPTSELPATLPSETSLLLLGDPERVPQLATLRSMVPAAFPSARSGPDVTVLHSARNPVDKRHFVTSFVGSPEALASRSRALFYYQFDGHITFHGRVPRIRRDVEAQDLGHALLLPPVRETTRTEAVGRLLETLVGEAHAGRRAGSDADRATRELLARELTLAGFDVRTEPFDITVKHWSPDSESLVLDGTPVAGARPLYASPTTGAEGVAVLRVETDPAADLTDAALMMDLSPTSEDPLGVVRQAAELAHRRGARLLLVRELPAPDEAPRGRRAPPSLDPLWTFPDALPAGVQARLERRREAGAPGDALMTTSGNASRSGSLVELPLPAVRVPTEFEAPVGGATLAAHVTFEVERVPTANVIGTLHPTDGDPGTPPVLLTAHHDGVGGGLPCADDNGSGLAAVVEAARAVAARRELLGRTVQVVFFGGEEWGLRGSRAYVASAPAPAVVLNADTVGFGEKPDVHVLGLSRHADEARVVEAALRQAGLAVGSDIDRFAYPHGSDHWPFHEAGVPALGLWSGDYATMNTAADTLEHVAPEKVRQVAEALALATLTFASR